MQTAFTNKLKQAIIQKQLAYKYKELINPTIRVNKDIKTLTSIQSNNILPSISNSKINITQRRHSQSAKKLNSDINLQKNINTKSTKKINHDVKKQQDFIMKKMNIQTTITKKQTVNESSNKNIIRSKAFSFKTPSRQQNKNITNDIIGFKLFSNKYSEQPKLTMKQLKDTIQKLNQNLYLHIKYGQIDSQNIQNKKVMAYLAKIQNSSLQEYQSIKKIIAKILKLIEKYKIKIAIIDLKQINKINKKQIHSNFQIVSTFVNKQQIISNYKIVGLKYYLNPQKIGKNLAASKIQSFFKMIFAKKFYKNMRRLMSKVKTIQKYWRMCLLIRKTRRDVLYNINQKIKKHEQLQKSFISNWPIIKTSNRYQIHICSYQLQQFKRLTTKDMIQLQNVQITRIFKAAETDVNIIYVVPSYLHQQIIKYYTSILKFQSNKLIQKIYFVVPQNRGKIQKYFQANNLTSLLYSPKALKKIKQIVSNNYAYIVPSFPSIKYTNLSSLLNIPVFGPAQNIAKLFSTKSGCLNILKPISLKEKPVFSFPKRIQSIYTQKQLINSLSILIFKYPNVKIWYLKIDDQLNSRGLAYIQIQKIAFLRQICKNIQIGQDREQNQIIKVIADQLNSKLKSRLKILSKDVYSNYDQYLAHFLTRGGIIQAGIQDDKISQFSISFIIDPTGDFRILGTYNKLELNGKSINQSILFPSKFQQIDYEGITRNIYKQLWRKNKFFGYFTADFIYSQYKKIIYAIGLDCFLNQKISSLFMMSFCSKTQYNKDNNKLQSIKNKQQKIYIYTPHLKLHKLPDISLFFKNCKFQNISFDFQSRNGTAFVLLDKLQSQKIGFFAVQNNLVTLLNQVMKSINHFCQAYRQVKNNHDQIGLLKGVITKWLKKYQKPKSSIIPPIQYEIF